MGNLRRFFDFGIGNMNIGDSFKIQGEEFFHISKVLRMKKGDQIIVCNGLGTDYTCQILSFASQFVEVEVTFREKNKTELNVNITLFQSVIKGKMDYVVQKATELGVREIQPFNSTFTIAKGEGKTDRLNKIALESSKQCGRAYIPFVNNEISFKMMLEKLINYDFVLFCNEREVNNSLFSALSNNKSYNTMAVIIGCEGGFSLEEEQELKQIAHSVTLGKRILRADTASVYVLSLIGASQED